VTPFVKVIARIEFSYPLICGIDHDIDFMHILSNEKAVEYLLS